MTPDAAWPSDVGLRLGTMGFAYADWSGPFYPPDVKPGERLRWYAGTFDAVELDTTFYAVPSKQTVRRWAGQVPETFRFTAKLPKQITHAAAEGVALMSRVSLELRDEFLGSVEVFEGKLRAVLMQFPPSFTAAAEEDLVAFLRAWPAQVPAALEVRHDSWWQPGVGPRVASVLKERNIAWTIADEPDLYAVTTPPSPEAEFRQTPRAAVLTGDWVYVRWIGRHEQYRDLARERVDARPRLAWWAARLRDLAAGGRVKEVVGFFNNGYSGHSPTTARQLLAMLGRPVAETPAERSSLF